MRLSIPLLAALSLATPAVAEVFTGKDSISFSLARGSVSAPEDADLEVTAMGVTAKHGIKRANSGEGFSTQAVPVLDEPFDLKDASGGKWRMWIRTGVGALIQIELVRARGPAPQIHRERVYRSVAISIDGQQADPTFPQLTLLPNGGYRLGLARGKYQLDEGGVTLDGVPAQWGRATYTVNGEGLVFRFIRGHALYEVRYELSVNLAGL